MTTVDPTVCPLCGAANQCAMEIAKVTGKPLERCWCVDAVFTSEVLAKVPQAAQGMSCICSDCAADPNIVIF